MDCSNFGSSFVADAGCREGGDESTEAAYAGAGSYGCCYGVSRGYGYDDCCPVVTDIRMQVTPIVSTMA